MLWSGLIRIIKIIKLADSYALYIDQDKSVDNLKSLSEYYKIEKDNQIIMNVRLNPLMLCNIYDQFKIKTTKKFIDIDFFNTNVFINLDINDNLIHINTMTKTETQINKNDKKVNGVDNGQKNKRINISMKKRFTSDLIDICKKIDN